VLFHARNHTHIVFGINYDSSCLSHITTSNEEVRSLSAFEVARDADSCAIVIDKVIFDETHNDIVVARDLQIVEVNEASNFEVESATFEHLIQSIRVDEEVKLIISSPIVDALLVNQRFECHMSLIKWIGTCLQS